ncbi:MAG TPA: hypothetical protein VNN20_02280 [Thermodesulfobacteriota bacterium]|nr:hypothetical protein [Thermodesulfobacteriota bacterium]
MDIQTEFQVLRREWENIKLSLEICGDIGDFDFWNDPCLSSDLARNLMEMDNKILVNGYLTLEAAYVFTTLATKAGENLGLSGDFAKTFGSGYGWVRTGWFDLRWINQSKRVRLKDCVVNQVLFFKLFFPSSECDFCWNFDSLLVRKKLKIIFDKFFTWQNDPRNHVEDFVYYKSELVPLWHGLVLTLDSLAGRC